MTFIHHHELVASIMSICPKEAGISGDALAVLARLALHGDREGKDIWVSQTTQLKENDVAINKLNKLLDELIKAELLRCISVKGSANRSADPDYESYRQDVIKRRGGVYLASTKGQKNNFYEISTKLVLQLMAIKSETGRTEEKVLSETKYPQNGSTLKMKEKVLSETKTNKTNKNKITFRQKDQTFSNLSEPLKPTFWWFKGWVHKNYAWVHPSRLIHASKGAYTDFLKANPRALEEGVTESRLHGYFKLDWVKNTFGQPLLEFEDDLTQEAKNNILQCLDKFSDEYTEVLKFCNPDFPNQINYIPAYNTFQHGFIGPQE